VRGFHRVGGGQVVVFAGVDDDAGVGIDHAREELVDEGALHVDVAEDDAVHRVVEHHVQPLHGAHGGDLGHAQARAVVGQPDVAPELGAHLVQRGAHEAEVLLRGVGAAKAFGGGAIGHVVQQALAGGADHGHDVGALLGGGAGLHDVFKDVAGGHDEVQPRQTGVSREERVDRQPESLTYRAADRNRAEFPVGKFDQRRSGVERSDIGEEQGSAAAVPDTDAA
jgi:hypothetical protein